MNPSSLAGHTIELLERVVKSSLPSDRVVQDFYRERRYLGSHDRRWINDKIYSIVRNFILLRELADKCAERSHPLHVFLAHEATIAGMQADELEQAYPSMFESYKMAGENLQLETLIPCFKSRYNEIERNCKDTPLFHSFPDFFPELLPENGRAETVALMTALNREARVCIRVDANRMSRDEAVRVFREKEIEAEPAEYSPIGLYLPKRINLNSERLYKDGTVEIQEESSQLIGLLVDPKEDETIVDACAGAGGKSLEIAALTGGKCRIYALDVDEARLRNLGTRAGRSGYTCISPVRVSDNSLGDAAHLIDAADKVVVDAPCSGSGTIRRNPDKKFRLTTDAVAKYAVYQRELLKRYASLVKPGGLLIYSTCSIFNDENFAVVESFLRSDGRFQRDDASRYLTGGKLPELIENGFLVIYPHRHNMDGFFAAVMKRVS